MVYFVPGEEMGRFERIQVLWGVLICFRERDYANITAPCACLDQALGCVVTYHSLVPSQKQAKLG